MAKANEGISGGFRGKVGNVVGVLRYGEYHIRSLPTNPKNPRTPKQQGNRHSFAITSQFCSLIKPFIREGYKTVSKRPWNKAISVIKQSAIRGENPNAYIDFEYVQVASGLLMPPKDASAAFDSSGNLVFEWADNSGEGNAKPGDRAMLLVVNYDIMQCAYQLKGAGRSAGQDLIGGIPNSFREGAVYAYMAFTSANDTLVSDSVYVRIGL